MRVHGSFFKDWGIGRHHFDDDGFDPGHRDRRGGAWLRVGYSFQILGLRVWGSAFRDLPILGFKVRDS